MAFHVTRLAGALGAEVRGFEIAQVDATQARELERLLWEHHVLFFPEQCPTMEEHVRFGELFGELENHPHIENRTPGLADKIFELSALHGGVADEWHTDLTFLEHPALYSILHMVQCPAVGGDTMWANLQLAYEELSDPIQELCEGLTAIHNAEPHDHPEEMTVHPMVRIHPETGSRVLYVNEHFTRRIVELSRIESDLLLGHLTSWVSNPRFTVRYRWSPGTVAMWDNRSTQHFVLNDFHEQRVIQRATVMGDRPEAASAARWKPYGRRGGTSDTSRHDALLREWLDRGQ